MKRKIDPVKYIKLLAKVLPQPISSEAENKRALALIEQWMDKASAITPEEDAVYQILLLLVAKFEQKRYRAALKQMEGASPAQILEELMLANDYDIGQVAEGAGVSYSTCWRVTTGKGMSTATARR